jgi:hypothetical protein
VTDLNVYAARNLTNKVSTTGATVMRSPDKDKRHMGFERTAFIQYW